MKMIHPLTWSEIEGLDKYEIHDVLAELPGFFWIRTLADIVNFILINKGQNRLQAIDIKILHKLTESEKLNPVFNLITLKLQKTRDSSLFSIPGCLGLINFILKERIGSKSFDLGREVIVLDMYHLVLAVLKINELLAKNYNENIDLDQTRFSDNSAYSYSLEKKLIFFTNQVDFYNPPDILYNTFYFWQVLVFLDSSEKYNRTFIEFLKLNGFKNYQELFGFYQMINGIYLKFQESKGLNNISSFRFKEEQKYLLGLSNITPSNIGENIFDFEQLRKKPFIKIEENYILTNYYFLYNALPNGILFNLRDFRGGVLDYRDLKGDIGRSVTEQILFNTVLEELFKNKASCFKLSEKETYPDAYLRKTNDLFFFELKDSLLPSSTYSSNKLEMIYKDLDKKFAQNEKKGIYQIRNHIHSLANSKSLPYDNICKPTTLLNIYPVIVYTDDKYSSPGVREYLDIKFQNAITPDLRLQFNSIKPLIMINLKVLFHFSISGDRFDIKRLFKRYLERIRSKKDFVNKNYRNDGHFGLVDSFEFVMSDILNTSIKKTKSRNRISVMINQMVKINREN